MQLHHLKARRGRQYAKRVGRGGKRGKTSGRGTKGQNARAGSHPRPEMRDIIKRLPKLRGRGKNSLKSIQDKSIVVNTGVLNVSFAADERITPKTLFEKGVIQRKKKHGKVRVKILGHGTLTKKLNISGCSVSKAARVNIEKVGGSIS